MTIKEVGPGAYKWQPDDESPDESEVVRVIRERVHSKVMGEGRHEYGPMDLASDGRDLLGEAIDEIADGLTYLVMHKVQSERRKQARAFRLVYMAHPISGKDIASNCLDALEMLHELQIRHEHTHAIIAPYLHELMVFDDRIPEQRRRGIARCKAAIERCDELWLCGPTVSKGMAEEAAHARAHGKAVLDLTEGEA